MSIQSALSYLKEEIIDKINSIPRYSNPWVCIFGSDRDAFGSFTVGQSGNVDFYTGNGYYRIAEEGAELHGQLCSWLPTRAGAIDMSPAKYIYNQFFATPWAVENLSTYTNGFNSGAHIEFVQRLLLPTRFDYPPSLVQQGSFPNGLYLSKSGSCNSSWIKKAGDNSTNYHVKCPVGSDVDYFLNKINISANDMVGIFNNMIDRSSKTTTKYITLGSTNLAKLTEEQKNIAYSKGWSLK